MPSNGQNREDDLRQLLTDAIEVQLAALKAGISFWSEWIEQTSVFVQAATKTLSEINSSDGTKDSLLELVDAGRASLRALTEIPRHTATRFIEELDKLSSEDSSSASSAPPSPSSAAAAKRARAGKRKRSGRVKV
jgi:hypothetical protein